MKKTLLTILSILLIAASVFGIFAGVKGVKEVMNVMEYKQDQANSGYYQIQHGDALITDRANYPEPDEEDAENPSMRGGISQLRANQQTYVEGVPEYEAGLVQLEEGKLALAEGQLQLNQGYADYAAGQQQLAEGKKTLDDGEAQYAAALKQYNDGVALIEANTQRYEEGKAQLAQIEPLLPYLNMYQSFRNGALDVLSSLPGGQIGGMLFTNAQAWFVSVVRPIGAQMGLDIPANVTDLPAYINQMVADGKAQMKEYEDGLAMLEAAKPQLEAARQQLDDGHVAYNQGQAALADGAAQLRAGEAQLADGKAQLADGQQQLSEAEVLLGQFEQGEKDLAKGAIQLMSQPAYRSGDVGALPLLSQSTEGKELVPSVAEMLAEDAYFGNSFDAAKFVADYAGLDPEAALEKALNDPHFILWEKDANGNAIILNGTPLLDLDATEKVANAGHEYIEKRQGPKVEGELIGRIITYALLALASVAGLLAGLFGLLSAASISKGKIGAANVCGWIAAILGIAGLVWGIIKGAFGGYGFFALKEPYQIKSTVNSLTDLVDGSYHLPPMLALLCLAVLGVLFVLVAGGVKRAYKRSRATVSTAAYTAAAPVAVPVAEPVVVADPVVKAAPVVAEPVVVAPVAEPVVQVVTPAESAAAAQAAAAAAMAAATPRVVVKTAADWAKEAQAAADEAQALAAAGDYEAAKAAARRAAAAADEAVKAANA